MISAWHSVNIYIYIFVVVQFCDECVVYMDEGGALSKRKEHMVAKVVDE